MTPEERAKQIVGRGIFGVDNWDGESYAYLRSLIANAIAEEREAGAKIAFPPKHVHSYSECTDCPREDIAAAIRART